MGQAPHPPTQRTTHCAVSALILPEPCNNRMRVIAKRLGSLHELAHAAGRVHFLGATTTPRTVFLICSRPFTLRTSIQKLAIISSDIAALNTQSGPPSHSPPAERGSSRQVAKKDVQDAACARKVGCTTRLPTCCFPMLGTSSTSVRFQECSDTATGLPTKSPSRSTISGGWKDGELRARLSRSRSHQLWAVHWKVSNCFRFAGACTSHLWKLHEDQRPPLVHLSPAMLFRQATPWGAG